MALYEHVFLARQDLAQAQVDGLAETATKIITDNAARSSKPKHGACARLRIASRRTVKRIMS